MGVHEAARGLRENRRHASKKTGTVIGVHRDYTDKTLVRAEVELPAPKRRARTSAKESEALREQPSTSVVVPRSMGLKVGDRVSVTTTVERG